MLTGTRPNRGPGGDRTRAFDELRERVRRRRAADADRRRIRRRAYALRRSAID